MEEFFLAMKLVFSVAVVGILSWILSVYGNLWHESQRVRKRLQMQGIKGPPLMEACLWSFYGGWIFELK